MALNSFFFFFYFFHSSCSVSSPTDTSGLYVDHFTPRSIANRAQDALYLPFRAHTHKHTEHIRHCITYTEGNDTSEARRAIFFFCISPKSRRIHIICKTFINRIMQNTIFYTSICMYEYVVCCIHPHCSPLREFHFLIYFSVTYLARRCVYCWADCILCSTLLMTMTMAKRKCE